MSRAIAAMLALLVLPALQAADRPANKTLTPRHQYEAILQEDADALKAFGAAVKKADTTQERTRLLKEKYPNPQILAPRLVELAEKNPTDPVALDALIWVVNHSGRKPSWCPAQVRAAALLLDDYLQSERLAEACFSLVPFYDSKPIAFLRSLREKSPHRTVRAAASLTLAIRLLWQQMMAIRVKTVTGQRARAEADYGKEIANALLAANLKALEAEIQRIFTDLAETYAADIRPDQASLLRILAGIRSVEGEKVLRAVMKKDRRHEMQGRACLILAQTLKQRADDLAESDSQAAEKLLRESEQMFQQVVNHYADLKYSTTSTVGEVAARSLFAIRHVREGKPAPETKGVDQYGKKLDLKDYRGKVVLLDFWTRY